MNSPKLTNIALLVLVLLLIFHETVAALWAPGRYSWVRMETSDFAVLDTRTGKLYHVDVDLKTDTIHGNVLTLVRLAKNPPDLTGSSKSVRPPQQH